MSLPGAWVLHYSWGATSSYVQTTLTLKNDGTFSGAGNGKWRIRDGTLLLSFDGGPAKYGGTIDGSVGIRRHVDVRGAERHLVPDAAGDDRRRRGGGGVSHPRCGRERALARASSEGGVSMDCQHDHRHSLFCILPPHMLESIAEAGDAKARKWALNTLSADTSLRAERIATQVVRAGLAAPLPSLLPHKQRLIYNANHGSALPGTQVRAEGHAPVGDAEVDEAYDGLGATFDLYWDVYKRNSIDNAGMNLIGTVHYLSGYDNAFWNGSQMVFGDGDGTYFNRFTLSIDVIGHELTHGVTAHQANLAYHDQPGALNESMSDVFGSLVKQYAHRRSRPPRRPTG